MRRVLRWAWPCASLGAALVSACATGLDVTEAERAEICSDPSISCSDDFLEGGGELGSSGTGGQTGSVGGTGGSSSTGGTAGRGGTGGTGATGGSGGITPSRGGSGGTGGTTPSNGGTGGTAGTGPITGGSCASVVAPVARGGCASTATVSITYTDRKPGETSTSEPSMRLALANTGASFDLSTLVIRYWFTADSGSAFIGVVDYANLPGGAGKEATCVSFGSQLGSAFADIGFTGTGTVGPEGVQEVQLRFHADPYVSLDQSNDFSYAPSAAAAPNTNLAVYVGGTLVGGCEPAAAN